MLYALFRVTGALERAGDPGMRGAYVMLRNVVVVHCIVRGVTQRLKEVVVSIVLPMMRLGEVIMES